VPRHGPHEGQDHEEGSAESLCANGSDKEAVVASAVALQGNNVGGGCTGIHVGTAWRTKPFA
jgi:hypothetical protein